MTKEEIERLYPEFEEWWRKEKGYMALSGVWLIKLWYEFLRSEGRRPAATLISMAGESGE